MTSLQAHIARATQLKRALTDIERDRIAREGYAAQLFADYMADVVIVAKQYRFLMDRCGMGRVG